MYIYVLVIVIDETESRCLSKHGQNRHARNTQNVRKLTEFVNVWRSGLFVGLPVSNGSGEWAFSLRLGSLRVQMNLKGMEDASNGGQSRCRENLTQKAGTARKFDVFFSRFLREKFTQLNDF